ncbi:hypothetical protein HHK36_025425 [Tetracentron sinense]|uniref:Myb-like domain-containing protein n=1 Tax=Tetracentron sinense TaxID=13715 RepID=A0A834YIJ7_TETSI|nr:hypothetical protein HHK36_025425 [Tetracentron sinense]
MGRSPCCSKEGLNRGAWTALEDKILTDYIKIHGEGRWRNLPKRAGEIFLSDRIQNMKCWLPFSMEKPMSKKMGSHVIRTKAFRCTTGFFTPQQHEIEHLHNKLAVGRPSMVLDMRNHIVVEQESCVVPSLIAPEEDNLSNFMLDFNVDEFFQSNILDTDFSELCYSNNGILRDHKKDTSNDLTLYIDQPLMFYEEMLKDWTGSDYINSTQLSFGSPIVSYF